MRALRFDLSTDRAMEGFRDFVARQRLSGKRPVFELVPEKRSLDQNAMSFALYKQIAEQSQDQSIVDIRRQCKLNYGIPILSANDPQFAETWGLIAQTLTYEQQLALMDKIAVTRLMKKPEFSEFLDTVIREYSNQGLCLLHPSEMAA